jgi:hypothetical protein
MIDEASSESLLRVGMSRRCSSPNSGIAVHVT